MKKYFVLFLALAATLSIGCGGGGGGGSTGASTVTVSKVAFAQQVTLPAGDIALASLRASTFWRDVTLKINGVEYAPTAVATDSSNRVVLTYALSIAKTDLGTTWNETTKKIENFQLLIGGQAVATLTISANDQSTSSTTDPTPTTIALTVTKNANGGYDIAVSSGTGTATSQVSTASDVLVLEQIKYTKANGTLATLTSDVTDVPLVATFTLYFNTLVTAATESWSIKAENLTASPSSSFTLSTPADASVFSVTAAVADGKSVITVGVQGDSTRKLSASKKYRVTLNSSSLARADKTSVKLGTIIRTFTTAAQ